MKNHLYIIPFLPSLSLIITGTDGVVVMNPGVVDARLTTKAQNKGDIVFSAANLRSHVPERKAAYKHM